MHLSRFINGCYHQVVLCNAYSLTWTMLRTTLLCILLGIVSTWAIPIAVSTVQPDIPIAVSTVQPDIPIAVSTVQPDIPIAVSTVQPDTPIAVSTVQPDVPIAVSTVQPDVPIAVSTVQPDTPIAMSTVQPDIFIAVSTVQPDIPIAVSTVQPDIPIAVSTVQPDTPIAMSTVQPDIPIAMSTVQPDTPIAMSTVRPDPVFVGSTVPSPSVGPSCGECNSMNIWTDVIFIVESSENSGIRNSQMMWAFVCGLGESFNIQPSIYTDSKEYMRVGIINYSEDVEVVGELGSVTFLQMGRMSIPFIGGGQNGTNIEKAIETASDMFSRGGHRPNSRKVIFLFSAKYLPTSDPQGAASKFKADGGVLFVYEYQPDSTAQTKELIQLASPQYYFHMLSSTYDDVVLAHCDANCFCLNNYVSFKTSDRGLPLAGCYYPVDSPRSLKLGNTNCKNAYNGGYIASAQTSEKQTFLTKLTDNSIYIIGLQNNNGALQWSDGSPLGSYHPYKSGPPSSSDMVIVNNGYWDLTNNLNRYWYVCESSPCSSNRYCDNQ
ncbi:unnamed protein product [Auanema sp. JU1783]|nr:unnamed protein product [Auanema sp. JU1783]